MYPMTVKLSMNIPKIIVHALFAPILNEIFTFFLLLHFVFMKLFYFWKCCVSTCDLYKSIITCIFHSIDLFTLYIYVYILFRYLIVFVLFCLFLNLLSSCLHTRYNVNVASYQIKSNQSLCILLLNIYICYIHHTI